MKVYQLTQVPEVEFRPAAQLMVGADELAERFGITFSDEKDDLGPYRWACVEVDGEPFGLLQYIHSQDQTVTVYAQGSPEAFLAAVSLPDKWRAEA